MAKRKRSKAIFALCAVLLVISALLLAAARMVPGFAQWYSMHIYTYLVGRVGKLTGLLPFSLAEALCVLLFASFALDLILVLASVVRKVKVKSENLTDRHSLNDINYLRDRHSFRGFTRHVLVLVSVLIFLYSANCGVNYYRDGFVDPEEYASVQFTEEDLIRFCEYIVENLQNNTVSADFSYPDRQSMELSAIASMERLSEEYDVLRGFYPRPKQLTLMSRLFSMMGVSGIYSPFTIEANVNGEMMGVEKPFTSCHELSHLRGFMNEGEANYIGWLACIGSEDPAFNRSGWLIAWMYAGSSLYRTDPDLYTELRAKLPDDAIRELDDNTTFWNTHENKASEVQDRVNDAYLKSNGQESGIMTYGQLTTLMLLWYSAGR